MPVDYLDVNSLTTIEAEPRMIKNNLDDLQDTIKRIAINCGRAPESVRLVAVSKRFPVDAIHEAHGAGQILFGENYLQEAAEKKMVVKDSVRFHFIGHLQSNKARIAAEIFDMIETVDRVKIATALDRNLERINRKLDILVQVNIGYDTGKSGVLPEKTAALLSDIKNCRYLRLKGLMTMPPFTNDHNQTRTYFKDLRLLANELQAQELLPENHVELSMGMSADYQIAIEEGATLIRIGTAIFGQRPQRI